MIRAFERRGAIVERAAIRLARAYVDADCYITDYVAAAITPLIAAAADIVGDGAIDTPV